MFTFNLAMKNILRARRRSVLTFLILAFGVGFNIFLCGITDGFGNQSIDNLIAFESGHFKIRSENFDPDVPYSLKNLIFKPAEIQAEIKKLPFVKGVTSRLWFAGELDNGYDSAQCTAIGVDLLKDSEVFRLKKYIYKGELNSEGFVLGKNLAEDMGITLETYVFLTFRNDRGEMDSVELPVTGLINTADPQVNNSSVYMDILMASELCESKGVTEISLVTDNREKYNKYKPLIVNAIKEKKNIQSWREMGDYLIKINQADRFGNNLFVVFIALIASIGVINTMIMSIMEKKREIGTLKALGMKNHQIVRLFVFEGAIIGFIGGLCGLILGVILNSYFVIYGMDISSMMGNSNANIGYKVMGVVHAQWSIGVMVFSMLISVLICTIASYYPARKAVSYEAAETLRVN